MRNQKLLITTSIALALVASGAAAGPAQTPRSNVGASDAVHQTSPQGLNAQHVNGVDNTRTDATTTKSASSSDATEDRKDAQSLVSEASAVVAQMKSDPNLTKLLHKAKGIYIVPDFGRAALIAGAKGGAGLVLAKTATGWSNPAFYDFGSISLGAQVGASGGSVAFLLMSQDAVDAFKSGNKFSLDSDAGLSIVNYSAAAEGSWGKGDIVFWSDTEGAYAGATVGITDLNWDDGNNQAYYGRKVDPSQIISGKLAADKAEALKAALSS